MTTVKEFFHEYLPDDSELEEFARWAFGEYYRELDQAMNVMETWNHLHSDKLELKSSGELGIDLPAMVKVWRDTLA